MKSSEKKIVKLKSGEKILICGSYDDQTIYLVRVLEDKLFDYKFSWLRKMKQFFARMKISKIKTLPVYKYANRLK